MCNNLSSRILSYRVRSKIGSSYMISAKWVCLRSQFLLLKAQHKDHRCIMEGNYVRCLQSMLQELYILPGKSFLHFWIQLPYRKSRFQRQILKKHYSITLTLVKFSKNSEELNPTEPNFGNFYTI